MRTTSLKNCLSTFNFSHLGSFFLLLCILSENRNKLKKIWTTDESGTQYTNIQTAFDILSKLVLRDHSKWRANKTEHGKGDNAHPNFHSKSNK